MGEFQIPDISVVGVDLNAAVGSRNNEGGKLSIGDLGIESIGE